MLGCLQAEKSVTAAEVRLVDRETQCSYEKPREQQFHEPPTDNQQNRAALNPPPPAVDLRGLSQDQGTVAEAMLKEEYKSSAFTEEDIGCIPGQET